MSKNKENKIIVQDPKEKAFVLSFVIHYVTTYGEEVYLNLDDYTRKKFIWTKGHLWKGTIVLVRPRTLRWTYSIVVDNKVTRTERLLYPREYTITSAHKYYHLYDIWDDPETSASPLIFNMNEPIDEHFIQTNVSVYSSPRSELITVNTSNLNRLPIKVNQRRKDDDDDDIED